MGGKKETKKKRKTFWKHEIIENTIFQALFSNEKKSLKKKVESYGYPMADIVYNWKSGKDSVQVQSLHLLYIFIIRCESASMDGFVHPFVYPTVSFRFNNGPNN